MASNLPELIGTNGFLTEIFRNVCGANRDVHWKSINKVKKAAIIRPATTHPTNIYVQVVLTTFIQQPFKFTMVMNKGTYDPCPKLQPLQLPQSCGQNSGAWQPTRSYHLSVLQFLPPAYPYLVLPENYGGKQPQNQDLDLLRLNFPNIDWLR